MPNEVKHLSEYQCNSLAMFRFAQNDNGFNA
jgi:hypothetical protein